MITQQKLSVWEKVIHTALDVVFPPKCAGCGAQGGMICQNCAEKALYTGSECMFCGVRAQYGRICAQCKTSKPIESVSWPWRYNVEEARTIIAAYKYRKKRALARALAGELARALAKADLPQDIMAVAVPLHYEKLRERGFNQAELLVHELALPIARNAVARIKATPPQAQAASRRERERQIRGAFCVMKKGAIARKNILIVDDVATTGATIVELAHTLKRAGASEIHAAVIAHG